MAQYWTEESKDQAIRLGRDEVRADLHVRFLRTSVQYRMDGEMRVDVPCPRTAARPSSSLAMGRIPVKTMISPEGAGKSH